MLASFCMSVTMFKKDCGERTSKIDISKAKTPLVAPFELNFLTEIVNLNHGGRALRVKAAFAGGLQNIINEDTEDIALFNMDTSYDELAATLLPKLLRCQNKIYLSHTRTEEDMSQPTQEMMISGEEDGKIVEKILSHTVYGLVTYIEK